MRGVKLVEVVSRDIKTVFLSGDEDHRDIFILLADSVLDVSKPSSASRMRNCAKQCGLGNTRRNGGTLERSLLNHGFTSCTLDLCAFVFLKQGRARGLVGAHVDDFNAGMIMSQILEVQTSDVAEYFDGVQLQSFVHLVELWRPERESFLAQAREKKRIVVSQLDKILRPRNFRGMCYETQVCSTWDHYSVDATVQDAECEVQNHSSFIAWNGQLGRTSTSKTLTAASGSQDTSARAASKRRLGSTWQSTSCGTSKKGGRRKRWASILMEIDVQVITYAVFCGRTTTGDCRTEKHVEQMMILKKNREMGLGTRSRKLVVVERIC